MNIGYLLIAAVILFTIIAIPIYQGLSDLQKVG
jgi:Zn-dependent membrane protease YugP